MECDVILSTACTVLFEVAAHWAWKVSFPLVRCQTRLCVFPCIICFCAVQVVAYFYNMIALLALFADTGLFGKDFGFSVLWFIAFSPCSFVCWYHCAYKAFLWVWSNPFDHGLCVTVVVCNWPGLWYWLCWTMKLKDVRRVLQCPLTQRWSMSY